MTEFKNDILEEADKIINGERNDDYGKAEDSFKEVGHYWNEYINHQMFKMQGEFHPDSNPQGWEYESIIDSHDVAMMMILLKVARTNGKKKRDNYVDICGYAALAEKL